MYRGLIILLLLIKAKKTENISIWFMIFLYQILVLNIKIEKLALIKTNFGKMKLLSSQQKEREIF